MSNTATSTNSNKMSEQVLQTPINNNTLSIHFKIIAGLISGLVAATILICIIVYVFKRFKTTRNRSLSEQVNADYSERINFNTSGDNRNNLDKCENLNNNNNDDSVNQNEIISKNSYKILLIYTCDCEQHHNVIKAFAHFLREICKLTVYFDYWDEEEIKTIGVESWLDTHLEISDYVLIIWSIGARIKCTTKFINCQNLALFDENELNFSKLINNQLFQYAINTILKTTKSNNNQNENLINQKYLNIYFDYSNKIDISYKFDSFKQFKLMQDFKKFLQHIYINQNFLTISNYLNIIINENDNNYVKLNQNNNALTQNKKLNKKFNKNKSSRNNNNSNDLDYSQATLLLGTSSSLSSTQFNENLTNLKLIYIEQLYKQINNTQNYFKSNPNWFENSLFNNNINNSTLTLDSCLINANLVKTNNNNNNNKNHLISLSSTSSLGADTLTAASISSSSLISLNSSNKYLNSSNNNNTNLISNNNNNCYNDYFMHPLPASIDANYFNLIEEKLNNNFDVNKNLYNIPQNKILI